jgi:carbamate kinase
MRHYSVFLRLFRRGWVYDEFGHFDQTHLRFFSLVTMRKLLVDAGLHIESVEPKIEASIKLRALNAVCLNRLEEFVAFQYLLKARKEPAA